MSTRKGNKKYRPVLSAGAISHILALAKSENPISTTSLEVIGILAPFMAKIENDAISAAYEATPKMSLEEKLGIGMPSSMHSMEVLKIPTVSKEEYWEQCYNKYKSNPISCTLSEIQAAREHMYLHDLMSPQEVREFERDLQLHHHQEVDSNN